MSTEKEISVSFYARMIGLSHEAIRKAVSTGKIVKGWNPVTKKIIPAAAFTEYPAGFLSDISKWIAFCKPPAGLTLEAMAALAGTEPAQLEINSFMSIEELARRRQLIAAAIERAKLLQLVGLLTFKN